MMRCLVTVILVLVINLIVKANKAGPLNGACYRDTFTRKILQGKAIRHLNPNSPEICKSICQEGDYKFAGVEAGTNCYCGNHIVHKNHPKVSQKHCRTPCPGNPGKFCGGKQNRKGKKKLYMNVYSSKNQQCPSGDLPGLPRKYCQPGEKCWPSSEDIEEFRVLIHGNESSCLGYAQDIGPDSRLKKFVYVNDHDAHVRKCLPYHGLIPSHLHCKGTTGKSEQPDPKCNSNPFITGAYYKNNTDNNIACMTPYQFLNNRNYKKEWMAAFILTASTQKDIIEGIKFANYYNLGISIMSTGHEFVDRNAGPGPNSFLIRTTCFRDWDPHPDDHIEGYNGTLWTDGYVELGVGHTFGRNFWWDIPNSEGVYALAANVTREMVGGTCHSVGIVGWTMGGGRGWTAPMFGLGVNQLLHVDMVTADGEPISANFSHNEELFWAIRGGGPGYGVITSMKVKLHKPKCRDLNEDLTMKNCYTIWNVTYAGEYDKDVTLQYVKDLLFKYSNWSIHFRPSWTSVVSFYYNSSTNTYNVTIEGRYFAYEDYDPETYHSFVNTFTDTFDMVGGINKTTTDKYWCEFFPKPDNTSDCYNIPWHVERWPQILPFMVNSSILENDFLGTLLDTWQPLCEKFPYSACATGYQFRGDMPAIDPETGRGVYATPSAISNGFNSASFILYTSDLHSIKVNLTYDQKVSFYHENLAPKMYNFSNSSYFNEAEYTLSPGQWERRFWGKEHHSKLLQIKKAYDPKLVFTCYHCVGSEVGTEPLKGAKCLKKECNYNGIEGKCIADTSPTPFNYVKADGNCEGIKCACWIPQTK